MYFIIENQSQWLDINFLNQSLPNSRFPKPGPLPLELTQEISKNFRNKSKIFVTRGFRNPLNISKTFPYFDLMRTIHNRYKEQLNQCKISSATPHGAAHPRHIAHSSLSFLKLTNLRNTPTVSVFHSLPFIPEKCLAPKTCSRLERMHELIPENPQSKQTQTPWQRNVVSWT